MNEALRRISYRLAPQMNVSGDTGQARNKLLLVEQWVHQKYQIPNILVTQVKPATSC